MDHAETGIADDHGEFAGRAGGEVVEDHDLVAQTEQVLHEVAADETGAAGTSERLVPPPGYTLTLTGAPAR